MSDTRSWLDSPWLFVGWAVFAGVNTALMYVLPGTETIAFHFVYVSMAIVYGLSRRPWSLPVTFLVLAIVLVTSGAALVLHAWHGYINWEETAEIPLMGLLFLVMVWHVRRRTVAFREAQRLAESEQQMQAVQKRFIRFGSHELRTPITVARGYAELIRDLRKDPQLVEDATVVVDELGKLERIATRLLTLAEVDESSSLRLLPIDLDALLLRTIRRWRPAARREWSLDSHAGFVVADAERLEAALDCLLENAIRFTGEDGVIRLRGSRHASGAVIEVTDDGVGIPPDQQAYVFENFQSGDGGGTGLGLAIVKAIVAAHGGSVSCVSHPELGTTFTMLLPAPTTHTSYPHIPAQRSATSMAPGAEGQSEGLAQVTPD